MRPARRHGTSGNAALEFGLSLAVMVPLLAGLFTYGYSFYQYQLLQHAVRDGARYAALRNYDSLSTTPTSGFSTAVQNMTVYGTPAPADGAAPLVRGLKKENIELIVTGKGSGSLTPPRAMTVRIKNYTINQVFGKRTLTGRPFATFPFTALVTP
jgi:hypothetical protein